MSFISYFYKRVLGIKTNKIYTRAAKSTQKKKKRNNFIKRAKKSNREDHWVIYRTLNNNLKKKCNSAKWNHLKDLADKLTAENNSKPFWNHIKSLQKATNDLVFLKERVAEITSDQEIAQHMNAYFSSVFTREQMTLPVF